MQNIWPVLAVGNKNIGITFLKQFDELTETTYDRTAPLKEAFTNSQMKKGSNYLSKSVEWNLAVRFN